MCCGQFSDLLKSLRIKTPGCQHLSPFQQALQMMMSTILQGLNQRVTHSLLQKSAAVLNRSV